MKHNIKLPDGTIKAVDCKIGSGVFDRNGKEIFESDRVKLAGEGVFSVAFVDGALVIGDYYLDGIRPNYIEVVGHDDD